MAKITICKDKQKLDIDMIFDFLSSAYWSKGRTKSMIKTTIENSHCFGVYQEEKQIGFARVVSDSIVFGYIMDVFILSEYRGEGHGVTLMDYILNDSELNAVQNWMLATSDAHGLYEKFGFKALVDSSKVMKYVAI